MSNISRRSPILDKARNGSEDSPVALLPSSGGNADIYQEPEFDDLFDEVTEPEAATESTLENVPIPKAIIANSPETPKGQKTALEKGVPANNTKVPHSPSAFSKSKISCHSKVNKFGSSVAPSPSFDSANSLIVERRTGRKKVPGQAPAPIQVPDESDLSEEERRDGEIQEEEEGENIEESAESDQPSDDATDSTQSSDQNDKHGEDQGDENTNAPRLTIGGKTLPPKCEFLNPWELGVALGDFAGHVECLIHHIKKKVMPAVRDVLREEMVPNMVLEPDSEQNQPVEGELPATGVRDTAIEGQTTVKGQDPAPEATKHQADEFLNRIFNPLNEIAIPILQNLLDERLPWLIESGLEEARLRTQGKST
jgi:hypothetical protein